MECVQLSNKEKKRLYDKEYNLRNKEKRKHQRKAVKVRKEYGISIKEYHSCMNTSEVCEICGTKNNLCYDHDHDTMEFRGVLCNKCNSGIGFLNDDITLVARAIEYLNKEN